MSPKNGAFPCRDVLNGDRTNGLNLQNQETPQLEGIA